MTTLSAKIKHSLQILTEMHNITEAELCRKTNISQATLNRLLTGSTDDPRASTLNAIAEFFNVTIDQLLGKQPITKKASRTATEVVTYIPVLSLKTVAEWPKLLHNIKPDNWHKWVETEPSVNKACFALEVVGDSMWPQFMEGTLLIIDPTLEPKNRDFVIAYLPKEKQAFFRQYLEEGKTKLLKPINHVFPSMPLTKMDKVMGVVIQTRNHLIN